ncbi:MAG: hypothetical protein ACPGRC_06075 [Salibacteraceae bacterium]
MTNKTHIQETGIRTLGKITSLLIVAFTLFTFASCEKENIDPPANNGNGGNGSGSGGNGGGSGVTQVDVNGLEQNYINAEGVLKTQLTRTIVEGYVSGSEDYTKMTYQGEGNTTITVLVKGSQLQEGNFSLKKFQLGSNPSENEAVVYLATNSTLLDFEFSDNDRFSIAKNAEGFFVIKLGPSVGIKRNSWDPDLTAPVSFHIVNNPEKIVVSDNIDGASVPTIYEFKNGNHTKSNQPFSTISLAQLNPGLPVEIKFIDYDFSSGTQSKSNSTLSQNEVTVADNFNGTVPKGIHFSYGNSWAGGLYTQDHTLNQTIEVELTASYIIVNYSDIKMVHTTDPTKTVSLTGEIQIAR